MLFEIIILFMICIIISIISIMIMKKQCNKCIEEAEAIRSCIVLLKAAEDRSNIK